MESLNECAASIANWTGPATFILSILLALVAGYFVKKFLESEDGHAEYLAGATSSGLAAVITAILALATVLQ